RGIDKNGCETDSIIYFETYIFWQENHKYWLKLIDNCGEFKKIEISNTYMDFYIDNFEKIKSNQVKKYSIKDSETGKTHKFSASHSFNVNFKFKNKNEFFKRDIDYYDL